MDFSREFDLLKRVLHKSHLHAVRLDPSQLPDYRVDMGLRDFLGRNAEYSSIVSDGAGWAKPNTIYKIRDPYLCNYVFLLMPGGDSVLIGPYLNELLTHSQITILADSLGVPLRRRGQMESYYAAVPLLPDDYNLMNLVNSFGEIIWGGNEAFSIVDMNQEISSTFSPLTDEEELSPEKTVLSMEIMENRYAYENELLAAVTQGHVHRADMMFASLMKVPMETRSPFEQRVADPVRNLKNYCIIMNTLLRKAAETGGVHPVYLNSVSSDFAVRIEALRSVKDGQPLMRSMIHSYCRLVKKHSIQSYASPVQKAITFIDADLSGDLSLSTLAAMQNVSAGYLSSLFKKETGQTLTEHVSLKRMDLAIRLLATTKLQIQAVAQRCGFSDVNYFSKTFKKYLGVSPKEYRASAATQLFR